MAERVPHELGEKRTFMFLTIMDLVRQDSALQDEVTQEAFKTILETDTADLSRWVAQCKPRYQEPRGGRPWVWEVSVSVLAGAPFREALDALSASVDSKRFLIAPHRWGQTQLHKQAWEDLKKLTAQ